MKRDLSFDTRNAIDGPSPRETKVSFGSLETVFFDKRHSSNNLSLGISVSNQHFGANPGANANSRWGEVAQAPSHASFFAQNRWGSSGCRSPVRNESMSTFVGSGMNPSKNMFLGRMQTKQSKIPSPTARPLSPVRAQEAPRLPARSVSPTQHGKSAEIMAMPPPSSITVGHRSLVVPPFLPQLQDQNVTAIGHVSMSLHQMSYPNSVVSHPPSRPIRAQSPPPSDVPALVQPMPIKPNFYHRPEQQRTSPSAYGHNFISVNSSRKKMRRC